jgi:hypothetical protein
VVLVLLWSQQLKEEVAKWFVQGFTTENRSCFVERKIIMCFLPGYKEWKSNYNPEPTGLKYIDHMVGM